MAEKKKKKENLPRGIMWREDRQRYLGRFTYQGKAYVLYDEEWRRLEQRIAAMRQELKEGRYIKESCQTLNDWFDEWMNTYKKSTVKYGTYQNYLNHYNFYIRGGIGKKKLKDITTTDIQILYNEMRDRNFAAGTIKLTGAALNGCMKRAVLNRMIPFNPVALAEIPKCKEKKERYVFSREEQKQFLKELEGSYLEEFFQLTLMTGLRNGEVRALRWKEIDLEKKQLHVNHTLIDVGGEGFRLETPKTKTSRRTIPMLSQVEDILERRKLTAKEEGHEGKEDFVFCLPDGSPLSRFRIANELERIEKHLSEEGVEVGHITCHTLRHAFATRAIEGGMKPQVLKTILGHSNISMTLDLYAHVLKDEKIQEMDLLEGIF